MARHGVSWGNVVSPKEFVARLPKRKKRHETKLIALGEYLPVEPDGFFDGMLISKHSGEKLYLGYVSDPEKDDETRWHYKIMSKLTPKGDIFYVFYVQYIQQDYRALEPDEVHKDILHTDIVYSEGTFRKRIRRLKRIYHIKKFHRVKLS